LSVSFSDLTALFKGSMSFTDYILNICSAIHISSHTKHSFSSSASCHHAERIPRKITESWKLQYVVSPPLENVATPLYHNISVALISCSCQFQMHCVSINSPHKEFLSRAALHQVLRPQKLCGYLHGRN